MSSHRRVEVYIPAWLMRARGYLSRSLVGIVKAESAKAIRVRASVLLRECDVCHRCGKPIDNPASRLLGYGPVCSDYLGLPHAELLAAMGPEDKAAVLRAVSQRTMVEAWLPKQHITITEVSMAKLVRVLTYEGPQDWIDRQMAASLADGVHRFGNEQTMTIRTEGGATGGRQNLFPTHEGSGFLEDGGPTGGEV